MAKDGGTVIAEERANKVCKIGQREKTCSYLAFSSGGYTCEKGSAFEARIRDRRAAGSMYAKGDNCSGPPFFRQPN